MVIFHSYDSLPEGNSKLEFKHDRCNHQRMGNDEEQLGVRPSNLAVCRTIALLNCRGGVQFLFGERHGVILAEEVEGMLGGKK